MLVPFGSRPLESLSPQTQTPRDADATHEDQGLAFLECGRAVVPPRRDARHVPMDRTSGSQSWRGPTPTHGRESWSGGLSATWL